jgi:hypothetical protein
VRLQSRPRARPRVTFPLVESKLLSAPREVLTITEAAARVRRSKRTIEYWINTGPLEDRLPVTRLAGVRYVELTDLLTKFRKVLQAPKGGQGHARPKST